MVGRTWPAHAWGSGGARRRMQPARRPALPTLQHGRDEPLLRRVQLREDWERALCGAAVACQAACQQRQPKRGAERGGAEAAAVDAHAACGEGGGVLFHVGEARGPRPRPASAARRGTRWACGPRLAGLLRARGWRPAHHRRRHRLPRAARRTQGVLVPEEGGGDGEDREGAARVCKQVRALRGRVAADLVQHRVAAAVWAAAVEGMGVGAAVEPPGPPHAWRCRGRSSAAERRPTAGVWRAQAARAAPPCVMRRTMRPHPPDAREQALQPHTRKLE